MESSSSSGDDSAENKAEATEPPMAEQRPLRFLSAVLSLMFLAATLVLMFVLSFWKIPLWAIGLAFGGVMLAKGLGKNFFFGLF